CFRTSCAIYWSSRSPPYDMLRLERREGAAPGIRRLEMLVTALVTFTLPAAAVVIYTSLRPLWAGAAETDSAGLGRTYRSIAIRTVLFVVALQLLIILNMSGVDWLRPIAPRVV